MINLLQNIIWLNIKKLKVHLFWRLCYVVLNYGMFFMTSMLTLKNTDTGVMSVDPMFFFYFFAMVAVANTIILYVKTSSEVTVVALYRSLGASKTFIILNTVVEMGLLFLFSVVLFLPTAFFRAVDWRYFAISTAQIAVIGFATVIFSLLTIGRAENIQKAR
ncbi:MAG: hypothetical protein A2Y33_16615 [Spirochaetes bacterium GWF1_51_8]|nr:MAG: hypothetical protein A2Y33_16615 [Spirochaetes bacterium GWF1_51_8]